MGAPQYEQAGADVSGSGTPGTIPVWSSGTTLGDSLLTQSGTTVRADTATEMRLGNTGTTNRSLAVYSNDGSARAIQFGSNLGGATPQHFIYATGPYPLTFATNGSERARIDSTGNVGIGTPSPLFKFVVADTVAGAVSSEIRNDSTNSAATARLRLTTQGGESWIEAFRNAGGALSFATLSTERARIDSSGNVGIGTASPGAQLHVERAGGTAANAEYLRLRNTTNATNSNASISFFVSNNVVATGAISHTAASGPSYDTIFSNWNGSTLAEVMRLQQGGNVILNTANTGATIQAAGSQQGLKLPATPGNTDPNTLDAYEDGGTAGSGGKSWTPTLTGFGGTAPTAAAKYIRVGGVVYCEVTLSPSGGNAYSSTYGTATITAPFASANNAITPPVTCTQAGTIAAGAQAVNSTTVYVGTFGSSTNDTRISWFYFV
jgi:hypothetical protein